VMGFTMLYQNGITIYIYIYLIVIIKHHTYIHTCMLHIIIYICIYEVIEFPD
jgi:hypothetical protein